MGLLTFRGGIMPPDGKELTKDKPVAPVVPVRPLVYPLFQNIGAPAVAVVREGEHVSMGQTIARAEGLVSSDIHSAVSGTVAAIEPHLTIWGDDCPSIIIEKDDAKEESQTRYAQADDLQSMTDDEIVTRIRNAGITGMGGVGYPAHVKLSPEDPGAVRYVIANCVESEPYLTSDYRLIMEEPDKLIDGIRVVLKLFDNAHGIIALDDNKIDAVLKLEKLLKGDRDIEIKVLQTKYPQGAERQLIYACTHTAVPTGTILADAGYIVHNVATLSAIGQAVLYQKPLTERIVTVTGDAFANPCNLLVPIGSSYLDLIDAAGGFESEPEIMISGGPMTGTVLADADVPVMKTSRAFLCMKTDEMAYYEPSACIKCGRCVETCPQRLVPSSLAKYADKKDEAGFIKWHGMDCLECGTCSYVCPAGRHLTRSIKTMRHQINAQK